MRDKEPNDQHHPGVNAQFLMDAFQVRMNGMKGETKKLRRVFFVIAQQEALKDFGFAFR